MEAQVNKKYAEANIIKFKIDKEDNIYQANIFPTHPYVTFTDQKWKLIEWTSYEFNTEELTWKKSELIALTINYIKEKWRSIIE